MHRFGVRAGLTALLIALGAGAVTAADPPAAAGQKRPWYKRFFTPTVAPGPQPQPATPPAKPKPGEVAASQHNQEMAAYLRRLAVCDKFKQIAQETGDDELMHKAEELEKQAEQIYRQRTAHLPGSRTKSAGEALSEKDSAAPATANAARGVKQ